MRSAATSSGPPRTSTPGWSPGSGGTRRPRPPSRAEVFAVVDAAFAQRRKTLRAALRAVAPVDRVEAALARAGVPASARGEQLDIAAFARIAEGLGLGAPA